MINNFRDKPNEELKYYLALQDFNEQDCKDLIKKRFEDIINQYQQELFVKFTNIKDKESYKFFESDFFKLKERINTLEAVKRDLFDLAVINRQVTFNKELIKKNSK